MPCSSRRFCSSAARSAITSGGDASSWSGWSLFALASIGCALSRDVHQLILTRGIQGVGGALLVPGSLALVSASFPERERGRAIGLWSGFTGITAALGPVLGGALVDHYSWVWAFLINVPLAVVVLSIAALRVPESRGDSARAGLDVLGAAVLGTVGLGGLVYAFIEAPSQHFRSVAVLGALGVGVAALLSFVAVERRVRSPMLPLSLLRIRNFAGANLLTLLLYAGLGGGLYFVPLNLIQVQGYSATAAGAALLPFILLMFLLSRWAGPTRRSRGPEARRWSSAHSSRRSDSRCSRVRAWARPTGRGSSRPWSCSGSAWRSPSLR